eukprot:g26147.t1
MRGLTDHSARSGRLVFELFPFEYCHSRTLAKSSAGGKKRSSYSGLMAMSNIVGESMNRGSSSLVEAVPTLGDSHCCCRRSSMNAGVGELVKLCVGACGDCNGERAPRDVGASRWATSSCDGSFSSGSSANWTLDKYIVPPMSPIANVAHSFNLKSRKTTRNSSGSGS